MRIRLFDLTDAPALADLFHASVHQIAAHDYSPAQCAAWSPSPPDPQGFHTRARTGWDIFVAVDDQSVPIGFIELEQNGHIDRFYCHPAAAGTGVGQALYDKLETHARDLVLPLLFVEASEPARRFFLRQRFTVEHRRDFERRGVAIHNYRMTKPLR